MRLRVEFIPCLQPEVPRCTRLPDAHRQFPLPQPPLPAFLLPLPAFCQRTFLISRLPVFSSYPAVYRPSSAHPCACGYCLPHLHVSLPYLCLLRFGSTNNYHRGAKSTDFSRDRNIFSRFRVCWKFLFFVYCGAVFLRLHVSEKQHRSEIFHLSAVFHSSLFRASSGQWLRRQSEHPNAGVRAGCPAARADETDDLTPASLHRRGLPTAPACARSVCTPSLCANVRIYPYAVSCCNPKTVPSATARTFVP